MYLRRGHPYSAGSGSGRRSDGDRREIAVTPARPLSPATGSRRRSRTSRMRRRRRSARTRRPTARRCASRSRSPRTTWRRRRSPTSRSTRVPRAPASSSPAGSAIGRCAYSTTAVVALSPKAVASRGCGDRVATVDGELRTEPARSGHCGEARLPLWLVDVHHSRGVQSGNKLSAIGANSEQLEPALDS